MSVTRRVVLVLAVLAAAAAVWAWQAWPGRPAGLRLFGNVDIREVNLAFRVAGRVQQVEVDEGDAVKPGQLLARLDPAPIDNEVAEAQGNAAALQARLALMQSGNRAEDIAQAAAQVAEREATLARAQSALAREAGLEGTGASSADQLEQARAIRDEAVARLAAARQALQALQRGFRPEEVAEARAQAQRAQALLAQSRLRLDDTRLLAPAAGVIMTRAVEPGAMVAAGATAFALSLPQPVWVRAYVKETELAAAKPGTAVQVLADALPGRRLAGRIGYVSPNAEFTPKNVETADLRTDLVYRLRIVVDDTAGELRQGMPVTVELGAAAH